MLLTIENNLTELMRFLETEKTGPRWFTDAMGAKKMSAEKYLKWLGNFKQIYGLLGQRAALFVERSGEIHFSILKKTDTKPLIEELEKVKKELSAEYSHIFGWVNSRNRMLKGLCQNLGMEYHGFRKYLHHTHGRVIEWQCYHLFVKREVIAPNIRDVLSLR